MRGILIDLSVLLFNYLRAKVLEENQKKDGKEYLLMEALAKYLLSNGVIFAKIQQPEELPR